MARAILDTQSQFLKRSVLTLIYFLLKSKNAMQRLMNHEKEVLKLFTHRLILNNLEPSHCFVYLV